MSSTCSRALLLAGLLASPAARAGACCVGSTTTIPSRLGECERLLGGLGVAFEGSVGRWDAQGVPGGSYLAEQSAISTLAAGWRWNREAQLGVSLPVRLQNRVAGDLSAWGGGPGDLALTFTWDPFDEQNAPARGFAVPIPVFTATARLPSGRGWRDAKGALMEDVTGRGVPALSAGVTFERTLGMTPWWAGLDAEVPLEARPLPSLTASAGVGRYLGTDWTLLGSLRHVRTLSAAPTARTTAGLRVVHGRRMRWRVWAGAEADLPVRWLGTSAMRQVSAGAGLVVVR